MSSLKRITVNVNKDNPIGRVVDEYIEQQVSLGKTKSGIVLECIYKEAISSCCSSNDELMTLLNDIKSGIDDLKNRTISLPINSYSGLSFESEILPQKSSFISEEALASFEED